MISCLFALAGCGSSTKLSLADTEMDTVYISADGNVELVSVEDFDKKDYSESDLKSFIKDAVSEYNDKQGKDSATMEDFTVKSKVAKVLLTFSQNQFRISSPLHMSALSENFYNDMITFNDALSTPAQNFQV